MDNLEAAYRGGECPVCGDGPQVPYELVFEDGEDDYVLEDEPEEPEFCEGCARQLNVIIVFEG